MGVLHADSDDGEPGDAEDDGRATAAEPDREIAPAEATFLVIDAAGQVVPLDLKTIAHTDRPVRLNQRFARMCQIPDGTLDRIKSEHELRRGLERGEFEVYFQPQAEVTTNRVVGAEALARWHHPDRGLLLPEEFIPLAEDSGLIVELGEQVLRTAYEQAISRQKAGFPPVRIAVNLSAVQFRDPHLTERVSATLNETGLEPRLLELEITESAAMRQAALAVEITHDLASLGVKLSLDDFGTGYCSLQYLKKFHIYALKIARPFVRSIDLEPNGGAIAEAIIAIGRSLELQVVAEGVETHGQLAFLRERGCGLDQGYLLAEPMPMQAFARMTRWKAA